MAVYGGKSKFEQFKELRAGSLGRSVVGLFFVRLFVCLLFAHSVVRLFKRSARSLASARVAAWVARLRPPCAARRLPHAAPPSGAEIVIATPGRLIDLVKMKGTKLSRVTYVLT